MEVEVSLGSWVQGYKEKQGVFSLINSHISGVSLTAHVAEHVLSKLKEGANTYIPNLPIYLLQGYTILSGWYNPLP